ncbi:MAG: RecQ family ATP-dependent DNA helicase [Flavobacteriales bacterium]|nr:RecQ family ATP-dependent DNA helicase [Flavobacteriales bacterium]
MNALDKVLILDLELDQRSKKLLDVGAVLGSSEFHKRKLDGLKKLIDRATIVAGHNLVGHDAPVLRKHMGQNVLKGKVLLDTLCWSALLYANKPYHKLVKGYKIRNEDGDNDPLSDAKLCRELLEELLGTFNCLPVVMRSVYAGLLSGQEGYDGMIELAAHEQDKTDVADLITSRYSGLICASAPLQRFTTDRPVELAHALALIDTTDEASILPPWVVHSLPFTQQVLHNLRFAQCNDAGCEYCATWMDAKRGLKEYFGYDHFRLFDGESQAGVQEKAVGSALAGESVLTVFPTGGGKSLTFQLPALMEGALTRSLTVVISPLVSLMKDQVEVLEHRHQIVRAAHLSGLLSPLERQEVLKQVEDGGIHLLYIAPETLRSPTLSRLLQKRQISRFVIDEAHCFSSWGHDFRVDYLYIAPYLKQLQIDLGREKPIPVSCFTATAKPQVVEDIRNYFKNGLGLDLIPYISQARRENLEYEVLPVEDTTAEARQRVLLGLLNTCEKPAIVYASRTKRVDELVDRIKAIGISVRGFHGKMEREEKQLNQESFMDGEVDVMVATSAFGMGVDKEDVRSVIHYNISSSLESYVQEAGRAGRNKDIDAKCYILYNENDLGGHFHLLQRTKLNQKEIQQVWRAVKGMTKIRDKISRSASELAKAAGWDEEMRDIQNRVAASLAALEDRGYIKRTLNSPQVFATGLMVKGLEDALRIVRDNTGLTEKQKENCIRVLQRLVKPDEDGVGVSQVDVVAGHLGMKLRDVIETVQLLRNIAVLNDEQDLTAYVDGRPRAGSKARLQRILNTEKALVGLLAEQEMTVTYRALNQGILDQGWTAG